VSYRHKMVRLRLTVYKMGRLRHEDVMAPSAERITVVIMSSMKSLPFVQSDTLALRGYERCHV
jgi:hypothetical protein